MRSKPEWNWMNGLDNFFRYLSAAVTSTKSNLRISAKNTRRSVTVSGIEELMDMSRNRQLDHDYTITIEGIYSDFPAILNLSLLFPSIAPPRVGFDFTKYIKLPVIPVPNFALAARLKPVKGLELASLYSNGSANVYDNCLPLFYEPKSIRSQNSNTGKKVRIVGKIIFLDNRWGNLYVSDKIPQLQKHDVTNYLGLIVEDIEVLGAAKVFYTDLWRMDHFQMIDYDEDCLDFYLINSPSNWSNVPNILNSYLSVLQLGSSTRKLVPWFSVVPKVNLLNSRTLKNATDFLADYYVKTYQKSVTGKTLIPINRIGHGICSPTILSRCTCIFQYDQVWPSIRQKYTPMY